MRLNLQVEGCVPVLDSFLLKDALLVVMQRMDGSLEEDAGIFSEM